MKKAEEHRKAYKSEAIKVQDKNHSDLEGRVHLHHVDSEVETIHQSRHTEKEERKPNTEDQEGQTQKRSVQTEKETEKIEETEIHVGNELYNEVQAWVKGELKTVKTPGNRPEKKKKQVPQVKNQPKLSQWFSIETEMKKQEGKPSFQESGKEDARQTLMPRLEAENKAMLQDIRSVQIKDSESEEEDIGGAAGQTMDTTRIVIMKEREGSSSDPEPSSEKEGINRLSEEEIEKIISSINKGDPQERLVQYWQSLTKEDFRTLQGKEYLNDKIIDSYLRLIQERSQECSSLPKSYACTTFFYTKLKTFGVKEGMKQTQNWIKEDLREKDKILCPIHSGDHWSLIAIDTKTRTVHYLDSLQGSRNRSAAPGIMKRFIEKYYRDKGEKASFKVKVRKDAPLQGNGVDCGVFTCKYAERESRGEKQDFKQEDLSNARLWMTRELMRGKLDAHSGGHQREITAKLGKKREAKTKLVGRWCSRR